MNNARDILGLAFLVMVFMQGCANNQRTQRSQEGKISGPLTIVAIGDAGETGTELNGNARYLADLHTGQSDGGAYDAMIFLGDNFYDTGLNIPRDEVAGKVKSVLGPLKIPLTDLGRKNVYAIPGNHDYYARNAIEKSVFFGLISVSAGPIGLTDRGNEREKEIEWWQYYYHMPASTTYPVAPEASDSVQIIFFDSALLLRTDPSTWRPALDSLRSILGRSASRPGIRWRILCMHQPLYSVGEHGGYSVWDDVDTSVTYLTACDKDSNALGWTMNFFDPEDLCTDRYREYADSLKSAIKNGGAKVQLALSGHDHSLQLLYYPDRDSDCSTCPRVHVVSGAGSKRTRVKFPHPPYEYTAAQEEFSNEGMSLPGFVQLRFEGERLRVVFFNGKNGSLIDMGGGRKEFWIDTNGVLLNQ